MPKISVITTTSRPNPRLAEMARTLACSLRRAAGDITLEWQVIDQTLGGPDHLTASLARWHAIATPFAEMLDQIDEKGELVRAGRARLSHRAVAHASALALGKLRNDALAFATGDYVIFLDDCTVVTPGFLTCAAACAAEGLGWRVKAHSIQDLSVPGDGVVRYRDHWDRLRTVPPATVGGPAWGVPRLALAEIGGFDLAYDGELRHNELETITRLSRIGVTFVSTERAIAVRLRRTQTQIAGPEAYVGKRNTALYNELLVDKQRVSHHGAPYVARPSGAGGGDAFGDDETPIADLPPERPEPGPELKPDLTPHAYPAGHGAPAGRPPGVPLPGLPPAPVVTPGVAPVAKAPPAASARQKPVRQRQRMLPAAMMSRSMVQKPAAPAAPSRRFATEYEEALASPVAPGGEPGDPSELDDGHDGSELDDPFESLEGEAGEAVNTDTDTVETIDERPPQPQPTPTPAPTAIDERPARAPTAPAEVA